MYDDLRKALHEAIAKTPPDTVLFSGGIDSSVIVYEAMAANPDVEAVTVGVERFHNSDVEYSAHVAKALGLKNHTVRLVTDREVVQSASKAVRLLKTFNPQWISSTVTLLLSVDAGADRVYATGEGSDDLFGSFPFFRNWDNGRMPLERAIEARLNDISIMSERIFRHEGVRYTLPYYAPAVKRAILGIPIEERTRTTERYSSKYPLRTAYEGRLPDSCLTRPQTMAFSGSGIFAALDIAASAIPDAEFAGACSDLFRFSGKLEYYLFRLYAEQFDTAEFRRGDGADPCVHCRAEMPAGAVVCPRCNTFQIQHKEIRFD